MVSVRIHGYTILLSIPGFIYVTRVIISRDERARILMTSERAAIHEPQSEVLYSVYI